MHKNIVRPEKKLMQVLTSRGHQGLVGWMEKGGEAQLLNACLFFFNIFIYLLIFGCVGSSVPRVGPLQLRRVGATLCRGAHAPHCSGLSRCRAQALGVWASVLRLSGSVVVAHGLQSAGSAVAAHGPSHSAACGILPDQRPNPCAPHSQADS